MNKNSKIFIAWHNWLVGSAIKRKLEEFGYTNLICKTRKELDLLNQNDVKTFFETEKPEYVFLAAAKVWWIVANNEFPADFIYQNLQIQNNIIHSSYLTWVKKLLFLGSSCIYPKFAPQPMKEEDLLTWILEPTNEAYAIAKIAGIKMCESYNRQFWTNFIACMPTNLYWPKDNFDLTSSHVLPAMIRKFHEAKISWSKEVVLWGEGSPMREFLYVDDMAEACIYMMENIDSKIEDWKCKINNQDWIDFDWVFLNIWTWKDITIKELAETVQKIVWFEWNIVWDTSKPNWTPRKLQDVSKMDKLWWKYWVELEEGIKMSYDWYLENK
jgi:GDP-L-fucose synthase